MQKQDFPVFENYPDLAYLDNAASTQKPKVVIETIQKFYESQNANVHRGIHKLSELATEKYEEARRIVAKFINAEPEEIVFTAGTTDSINGLAQSLGSSKSVLSSYLEHHSNFLPWTRMNPKEVELIELDKNYQLQFEKHAKPKWDIVALTHMSNVTGTITPIEKIRKLFPDSILAVDAAQSIAHIPVDVKKLDVDFLAFSGHKIYGPTGIGVLYGKKELLQKLEPLKVGGGMILEVDIGKHVWADLPERHEAGTPPIAQAVGLGSALEYVERIGKGKIKKHEMGIREFAIEKLSQIDEIELYHPDAGTEAGAVISFNIKGVHPHDGAQILADQNVAVRAGHHCAQILHRDVLHAPGSLRASFGLYNDREDVEKLFSGIKNAIKQFS